MGIRLDFTMMYTMHDALRRELERLARITAKSNDDPIHVLTTAAGWEMFKKFLHVHHTSEDEILWPAMREANAGKPDELALLDAMEAEHAIIDPMLAAIDAALSDRDNGPAQLGERIDALATGLSGHLAHEERDTLPLMDATVPQDRWNAFGELHQSKVGADTSLYMPWLLDEATPERIATILSRLPQPVQQAYASEWVPAYRELRAGELSLLTGSGQA